MAKQKHILVAFLAVHTTQEGEGYIGGILVTDEAGIPKEFRCTRPIRPTATQKALYGANLKPHVFNQLVGVPLILSLVEEAHFCVVAEPVLLQVRDYVDIPVFNFQRYGDVLSVMPAQSDGANTSAQSMRIDSEHGGFQPIEATCHRGYESDLEGIEDLSRLFNQVDLLEPFERIAIALKTLADRDGRFR